MSSFAVLHHSLSQELRKLYHDMQLLEVAPAKTKPKQATAPSNIQEAEPPSSKVKAKRAIGKRQREEPTSTATSSKRKSQVTAGKDSHLQNVVQENEAAVAFWHDPARQDGKCRLLDHLYHGINTATMNGKLKVVLYSYQEVINLPDGVERKDALEILAADTFQRLMSEEVAVMESCNNLFRYVTMLAFCLCLAHPTTVSV